MKRFLRLESQRFNFDTYQLVKNLEQNGFTRSQAIELMKMINTFLVDSLLTSKEKLVSNTNLEHDRYLQKSRLQDIRNELASLRHNETTAIRQLLETLQKNTTNLDQITNDKLLNLKSDLTNDVSNHRQTVRDIVSKLESKVQDINHKLVIDLAEVKTRTESLKIELTTHLVWMAFVSLGGLVIMDWLF